MNLALSDDQRMIREAAQSFLADASSVEAVRAAVATPAGYDEKVWRRIGGELGWCGTALPEAHGGLGLGPLELALIVEQTGRHLLCAPFFSTVCLAATLLAEAGSRAARRQYLPDLAAGRLRATAVYDTTGLRVTRQNKRWLLDGWIGNVSDGDHADLILLVAQVGAKRAVFAVPGDARGLARHALPAWDGTRRTARLRLHKVAAQRVDDAAQAKGIARAEALARLYLAAEQLGAAQQCLDLAVRHTTERRQFGRAIASFQAVKHRCAGMMVQVEALRSAVYGAAALAATRPPLAELDRECAMAKALASDTAFHCAQEAIQLHGGVGFTWEYAPQLYFKRAQASSHWLGTSEALRERIAATLLD